ncbi:MAG: hypothetical protein WCC38_00615 [Pseudonocardiaceae bacterium]
MAAKKITVTLDADQLARIRSLVGVGKAQSVSGFVQHGGDLIADERAWADRILGIGEHGRQPAA